MAWRADIQVREQEKNLAALRGPLGEYADLKGKCAEMDLRTVAWDAAAPERKMYSPILYVYVCVVGGGAGGGGGTEVAGMTLV